MSKKKQLSVDPASPIPGVISEKADGPDLGEPLPLAVPPGGWPADEFTGAAGRFVRDPFTGVRTRAAE